MARIVDKAKTEVRTIADGIAFVKRLSLDGNCWVYHVCFGMLMATAYRIPSHIPYTAVGNVNWQRTDRGYYQSGEFHTFSEHIRTTYENAALGCE